MAPSSAFARSINALKYAAANNRPRLRKQWADAISLYIEQQNILDIHNKASEDEDEDEEEEVEEVDQDEDGDEDEDWDDQEEDEDKDVDYILDTRQPFATWAWHNIPETVLLASITAEFGDTLLPPGGSYPKRVTQTKLKTLLHALPAQPAAMQDHRDRGHDSGV